MDQHFSQPNFEIDFFETLMKNTEISLDTIFDEFKEKILNVNCYQSFTKSIWRAASEDSKSQYEKEKTFGMETESSTAITMMCKDLLKGEIVSIGSKEFSIEEYFSFYVKILNRQYQWLLVEAYEAYENYLKKLYANIGYLDPNFWEAKDFGTISISEIKNCELNWFIKRVEECKKPPEAILKQIHKKIPALKKILAIRERNDPAKIEYKFMINLISKLRHIIVHCNGITEVVPQNWTSC